MSLRDKGDGKRDERFTLHVVGMVDHIYMQARGKGLGEERGELAED